MNNEIETAWKEASLGQLFFVSHSHKARSSNNFLPGFGARCIVTGLGCLQKVTLSVLRCFCGYPKIANVLIIREE